MTRSRQTADWGSRAGLAKIVPSSITVGSGTGSVNSLGTVTFSGCSSVSLNNTFNSTYSTYKILMKWTATANQVLTLRVRSGTTNYTGAEYNNAVFFVRSAGTTSGVAASAQNQTGANLFGGNGFDSGLTCQNQMEMTVTGLFTATSTTVGTKIDTCDATGNTLSLFGAHRVRESTSRDGLDFITNTGTITGSISVFGVNE